MLELAAQSVALVGGGTELGQPFEGGAELLAERIALGGYLGDFGRPAVLLLGERGLELNELAAQPVAFVGGGAELGQPFEGGAELLAERIALGG